MLRESADMRQASIAIQTDGTLFISGLTL